MKQLLLAGLMLLSSLACAAQAGLDQLLDNGKLTIESRLEHNGTLVPGQRARLIIEVATSTWFTGGTRIRLPEVPGLVILQTDQFAANASETRDGQAWVIQRWTLDLYPQRAGDFLVPPIKLSLQVNGGALGNIEGEAESPPLAFGVRLPAALEQAEFWVASPDYRVEQALSQTTDALQPGDAFERTVTFEAKDVLAMMLPEVTAERQAGLAAYPAPPKLENTSNRGQSKGTRVQTITYLAEEPGSYLLPAKDFFWWDTGNESLQVLSIPAIEVRVVGGAGQAEAGASGKDKLLSRQRLLVSALVLLALLVAGALLNRYRPWGRLAVLSAPLANFWQRLRELRKPALPRRLNPDSSAGD